MEVYFTKRDLPPDSRNDRETPSTVTSTVSGPYQDPQALVEIYLNYDGDGEALLEYIRVAYERRLPDWSRTRSQPP
jgi:hypothetical protein